MEVSPKVATAVAGSMGGSQLATVMVWLLGLAHVTMPTEVAMAIAGLVGPLLGGYLGWLVPHTPTS